MSELPEDWLRAYVTMEAKYGAEAVLDPDKAREAADELARLRAENERSLEYFGKMHETLAYVRAENERLKREAIMTKAAYDGVGSLLLDVQSDCIAAVNTNAAMAAIITRLLECPEIADCAPEDLDPETRELEREARQLLARTACARCYIEQRDRIEALEAFANEVINRCEAMGMPGHQLATLARATLKP